MSKYLLKIIGTGEIVNIVEWNGSGSLVAPTGYEFEPFLTEDTDFINYFETIMVEDIPSISGNLFGQFTGELTGSVLFNGETFNELIHKTKYGELRLVSGSDIQRVSESYSMILSNDNIVMPLFNKIVSEEYTTNYQSIFNKVIDENISNYVISFKQADNPNIVLDYLVHQTELTSSGDFSYYNISASLFGTASFLHETNDLFNSPDFLLTNWYVDFDLGESPKVGKFYGDFNGTIGGKTIDEILKVTDKTIQYELIFSDYENTDKYHTLQEGDEILRLDSNTNNVINSDIKLALPLKLTPPNRGPESENLDYYYSRYRKSDRPNYHDVMYTMLRYGIKAKIRVEKKNDPNTFKEFRITNMDAFSCSSSDVDMDSICDTNYWLESNFNFNGKSGYTNSFFLFDWIGGAVIFPTGFKEEIRGVGQPSPNNRFDNYLNPFPFNCGFWFGYYEVDAILLNTSVNQFSDLDELVIYFDLDEINNLIPKDGKRSLEIFEQSTTWTVPSWAEKVTVCCIGGGGGGGGGAAGKRHTLDTENLTDTNWFFYGHDSGKSEFDWDKVGHEIVFGGGGGGGGSCVVATIDANDMDGVYNIIVGSGGKGADGCSMQWRVSNNEYNFSTKVDPQLLYEKNDIYTQIFTNFRKNSIRYGSIANIKTRLASIFAGFSLESPNRIELGAIEITFPGNLGPNEPEYLNSATNAYDRFFSIARYKYDGKDGGKTIFEGVHKKASNGVLKLSASGGQGGQTGTAIRGHYYYFHLHCWIDDHYIPRGYIHGGNTAQLDLKNESYYSGNWVGMEIEPKEYMINRYYIPGSPGGYGISMPYWTQFGIPDYGLQSGYKNFKGENIKGYENSALSVPIEINDVNQNSNIGSFDFEGYPYIKYGKNQDDIQFDYQRRPLELWYQEKDFRQLIEFVRNENPIGYKNAFGATGGGGGAGKQYLASDPNIHLILKTKYKSLTNESVSTKLHSYLSVGKGGSRASAIDIVDIFDKEFGVKKFDLTNIGFGIGGDGGLDHELDPSLNTSAKSGNKYGGGGGGGAGKYFTTNNGVGETGGDGADGVVIIGCQGIAEFELLPVFPPR